MEIILGEKAGFCYGVKNAVEKANESVEKNKNIYCLGELVHNKQVVESLEQKGMITVNDISEVKSGCKVIFRAHGISKNVYKYAEENKIEIIDLTCPSVLAIHRKVESCSDDGFVFIIGEKYHPESIATASFADNSFILENEDDIELALEKVKKSGFNKIYIFAQTTFSMEKFDVLVNKIKSLAEECELIVNKTICNATKLRQEETEKIAKEVELMIIIGGKNSANTKKLYYLSVNNCENVILVQTKDNIDLNNVHRFNKIGIMAGASTPEKSINDIIEYING